jgi:hypothetical protein
MFTKLVHISREKYVEGDDIRTDLGKVTCGNNKLD